MNIWFLLSVLLSYRCTHACTVSSGVSLYTQIGSVWVNRSLLSFQIDTFKGMWITHTGHFLYVIKMLTIISSRFFSYSFSFSLCLSISISLPRVQSCMHSFWTVYEKPKDVLLWNRISIRHSCYFISCFLTLLLRWLSESLSMRSISAQRYCVVEILSTFHRWFIVPLTHAHICGIQ